MTERNCSSDISNIRPQLSTPALATTMSSVPKVSASPTAGVAWVQPPVNLGQPDGSVPPGDKVMHSAFTVGESLVMASDGMCSGKPNFIGFSLSYPAKDGADARRRFDALSFGGRVHMPLAETFFAESFGMVTDKFGVSWMVMTGAKQ